MSKYQQRIQAQKLRKTGLSLKTISQKIGVSKSSVSLWCRDLIMTEKQKAVLLKESMRKNMRGRLIGAETNKQKKKDAINKAFSDARNMLGNISNRDLLLLGAGLFWGEGSKTGPRFIFINSDPAMIKLMKDFLVKNLNISPDMICATVQINIMHKPRIGKVMRFWSEHLDIPISQFNKPYYVRTRLKKIYKNYDVYNGILRLRVLRSSVLQYKMLGLVNVLKDKYMPA